MAFLKNLTDQLQHHCPGMEYGVFEVLDWYCAIEKVEKQTVFKKNLPSSRVPKMTALRSDRSHVLLVCL